MDNREMEFLPETFDVQQWSHYLPPLSAISVSDLQNIGENYEKLLITDIQSGSVEQFYRLWNLYGNIVKNCFSMIKNFFKIF